MSATRPTLRQTRHRRLALSATFAAVAALAAACGSGGGDDDDDNPLAPPPPAAATITTTVIDGAIENALVCVDRNDNAACDDGEPSARSGADGKAVIEVDEADIGAFPLVAQVGTDAKDADHGPVQSAYTLRTPAERPAAITSLTTLLKAWMEESGFGADEAEATLKERLGVETALSGDFRSAANGQPLAALARLLVLLNQSGSAVLKTVEGQEDDEGNTYTAAVLAQLVGHGQLLDLPEIAALAGSDAVRNAADAAARESAIQAAAESFTQEHYADASPEEVGTFVQQLLQSRKFTPADPNATPQGGSSLRWFAYADAGNWSLREFYASAAQNTPDADGKSRYQERRKRAVNGTEQVWGTSADYTRTDVYWTGSEWFDCPIGFEHNQTQTDDQGVNESTYCQAFESRSRRYEIDVSGENISSVLQEIRDYNLKDSAGDFTQWGPDPATSALAGLTFPDGSFVRLQATTDIASPDAYSATSEVLVYTAGVADGVEAECAKVTGTNFASFQQPAATLENLVERNPGKACVYTPNDATGPRHEWWSNSTVSLGTVSGAAPALPYYSSSRDLRIGFESGDSVNFYVCAKRASDGSTRNCDLLGTGTRRIETVGDARVMRFSDVPLAAAALTYSRTFVERGGKVYFGFRTKPKVDHTLRLNATATDALFAPLAISRD